MSVPVFYRPPDDAILEHLARQICDDMASHFNKDSFRHHEVVLGLADFFKQASVIEAGRRNRASNVAHIT